jgi:acetyl esterase/lipase
MKVVPDKEGSEAAPWLNGHGIAVFVLRYRTHETTQDSEPVWQRPLQDAQRAMRLIRANAEKWHIQPDRVGVLGFSAGGQVAAILHTCEGDAAYEDLDQIDALSCIPDFSLLVYPWRVLDDRSGELLPQIRVSKSSPPAFIVHTHDDASSSLGSVMIYADLKRNSVPAELHVYSNGGHGYGMRPVQNSDIGSWPDRASDWMLLRGIARAAESE